jgi:hypothetical protein
LSIALDEKAWLALPQEKKAAGEPTPAASNALNAVARFQHGRGPNRRTEFIPFL